MKLCDLIIAGDYPFVFSCDIRGNYIDRELIRSLEKAGFVKISIGFEDADNAVLKTSSKGLTYEDNVSTARLIKDYSEMIVSAYWIVALPGSTTQSLEYNIEAVRGLIRSGVVDMVNNKLMVIYPGTPFFEEPSEFGIEILSKDWVSYDRRLYPPMYRLNSLSEDEIYHYFLELEKAIIEEYSKVLNISINELFQYSLSGVWRHTALRYLNNDADKNEVS